MKRLTLLGLILSFLTACSISILNHEETKQTQGLQQGSEKQHQGVISDNEWDSAFNCTPSEAKKLIGKSNLSEKQILSMTNSQVYRSARPGEPVTEDYRPNRITIVIDPHTKNIVASACG